MRSRSVFLIVLFFFALGLQPGWAAETPKTFAVLPFAVHGPQKYRYLEQGIASMLTSRLTWENHLVPMPDEGGASTQTAVQSQKQAAEYLAQIDADTLFWGSVTIVGDQASLDVQSLNKGSDKAATYSKSAKVADIIPAMEQMVDSIHADMFPSEAGPTSEPKAEKKPQKILNSQFVQNGMTGEERAQQSGLNPSFDYTYGAQQGTGRWQSQALPFTGIGMIVADANNDGDQEIFLLGEHQVIAYAFKQRRLIKLDSFEVPRRVDFLNINALDMDRDKLQEIVISGRFEDTPRSYVLEFKDKKFQVLHGDIDLYFNVVGLPPNFTPRLVAQKAGRQKLFARSVHEVVQMKGSYQLGSKLNLPSKANVFNFAYLPQKDMEYKIVVADSEDHLRVYSRAQERQFQTDETYASSGLGIGYKDVAPGMEQSQASGMPEKFYYIPNRLLPINLDNNSQYELLVNQSQSVAADFFPRYRNFPQGQMFCLRWDGLGLSPVWKTKVIKGTIVDYGIGDLDSNGQDDLYICVNTHPGALGVSQKKTMILAYPLKGVEKQEQSQKSQD